MSDSTSAPELSVYSSDGDAAQHAAAADAAGFAEELLQVIPRDARPAVDESVDPSPWVGAGDTVVEIGSAVGLWCRQMAQIVGSAGRVVVVDGRAELLALARGKSSATAERWPFDNIEFRRGLHHDLQLDLEQLDAELVRRPVGSTADWLALRALEERLRHECPLISESSVDCVVAHAALNVLQPREQAQLFHEMFRVLRVGGRVIINDLVADEEVADAMRNEPALRSTRIGGALREDRLLQAFEQAGFHGIEILQRDVRPRHTVQSIEFRSMTISAWKGKQGICLERNQALVYRGPFKQVEDDDGHVFPRGERIAVCDKTFKLLGRAPYEGQFVAVEPNTPILLEVAGPFDCRRSDHRAPGETKRGETTGSETKGPAGLTIVADPADCCGTGGNCC